MIKDWFTKSKIEDAHPSEEDLLKHVDGELSPKEGARVRSHLETCWSCRLSLEKIEETISAFVEFRQQIQIPLTQPPPGSWNGFDRRLTALVNSSEKTVDSWWLRSGHRIGRFFQSFALFSTWLADRKQTALASLAAVMIGVLIWQLVLVRPISANEILDKSLQFQTEHLRKVPEAVVYQKLRIRRNGVSEINWEVWRDTTRSRFRQNVTSGISAAFDQELLNVLQLNSFDPQQPLSPATFATWRKGLAEKSDAIEQTTSDDGSELIILRTTNPLANRPGQINDATLKVRAADFHPIGQILNIHSAAGIQIYEFTELDFQVVSLRAFAPDFFPEPAIPQIASAVEPPPIKSVESNSNTIVANTNSTAKQVVNLFSPASADLEVEVFSLLNKAKADLGEQITVTRDADGRLNIRGLVDDASRKNEILETLASVRNDPAVRIDLKTIDEAVAEQRSTPKPSGTVQIVEGQSSSTAADSEVLSYFKSEEEGRRFGAQMIARSGRAMSRAYALKRLMSQFSSDELRKLSPAARDKYLAIVRSHASVFRDECERLGQELQPVFGSVSAGVGGTPSVGDITTLPGAIDALVALASTNDRVVRSAFTLSSNGSGFTAIKTKQFWQSLKTAESLAAKLQSVK